MKAKIHILTDTQGKNEHVCFWCPNCKSPHAIPISRTKPIPPSHWFFDGNLEQPTIEPSLRVFKGDGKTTACHLVMTKGLINFCTDTPGQLSGVTVPVPEWDREQFWGEDEAPAAPQQTNVPPPPPAPPAPPRVRKTVVTHGIPT